MKRLLVFITMLTMAHGGWAENPPKSYYQGPTVSNYHWPFDAKHGEPITEDQCLMMAGHYWREDGSPFLSIGSEFHFRVCRFCGKKQRGVDQPGIDWQDTGGEKR